MFLVLINKDTIFLVFDNENKLKKLLKIIWENRQISKLFIFLEFLWLHPKYVNIFSFVLNIKIQLLIYYEIFKISPKSDSNILLDL